ncbi:hypothetical protein [Flavobacterium cerinum]|uniref:Lipocalin-like domain-containing protein n=1 Tax=Flavobacterium cerinum TaxID=2502784 RepID=A0ABY5IPS4_9FLAO|nr:hypothetical protein [Flavobacterium cerinum]UUC44843.1 hypothetical protein NOX80_14555 [Flavobacterium cerinum]
MKNFFLHFSLMLFLTTACHSDNNSLEASDPILKSKSSPEKITFLNQMEINRWVCTSPGENPTATVLLNHFFERNSIYRDKGIYSKYGGNVIFTFIGKIGGEGRSDSMILNISIVMNSTLTLSLQTRNEITGVDKFQTLEFKTS